MGDPVVSSTLFFTLHFSGCVLLPCDSRQRHAVCVRVSEPGLLGLPPGSGFSPGPGSALGGSQLPSRLWAPLWWPVWEDGRGCSEEGFGGRVRGSSLDRVCHVKRRLVSLLRTGQSVCSNSTGRTLTSP